MTPEERKALARFENRMTCPERLPASSVPALLPTVNVPGEAMTPEEPRR